MVLSTIRTYNFRNLNDGEIDVRHNEIFLVGDNGQGKTNFLEAVYYLCYGSSFRLASDKPVIASGAQECLVEGRYVEDSGSSDVIRVSFRAGSKAIELNGKRVRDRKELIYKTPCILFCHEDMDFVVGAMERRRQFFDQTLTLYDPLYIDSLRRYRKILVSRNAALKERHTDILDIYDEQLAAAGTDIVAKRRAVVEEFGTVFSSLFREVSGIDKPLTIDYLPSWKETEMETVISRTLKNQRDRDLEFGSTTSGPHRDSFSFRLGKEGFTQFASTGQVRLASLALRIGQALFFSRKAARKPIMLFDDVLLELDPDRKKRFLNAIPPYEQAFFTFLPGEPIGSYEKADTVVYSVEEGLLRG
jgi:DNA replication and repair protein RecF